VALDYRQVFLGLRCFMGAVVEQPYIKEQVEQGVMVAVVGAVVT